MVGPNNKQDFWSRINILEGIWAYIILENKVVQKLMHENNAFTKSWSPKFFNERTILNIDV